MALKWSFVSVRFCDVIADRTNRAEVVHLEAHTQFPWLEARSKVKTAIANLVGPSQ